MSGVFSNMEHASSTGRGWRKQVRDVGMDLREDLNEDLKE